MNRDEILNKSRNENKSGDERVLQMRLKAKYIAKTCGIVIAYLLVIIGRFHFDTPVIGLTALTIAHGMGAIEDWAFMFSSKKFSEWPWVILDTSLFVYAIVRFINVAV